MSELINGVHEPCTKAHWCNKHCPRRLDSEAGMPSCDCDQFDDEEELYGEDDDGYPEDDDDDEA